ncbi:hypothetical protein SK854_09510 [Lentzea sp. BCCO 10_0061]|uniref:Uncharacterized protein n=1 Tax=Lentzea sokolovensis TaxID=3095429 RepID=A0ABU4USB0_9PSEU|nr:hypothetical protein [Lentzea sp. BCCO 10_0061]MDX8142349.1 hypothetical protein [Lentzea sp. BCCO 10_0061]
MRRRSFLLGASALPLIGPGTAQAVAGPLDSGRLAADHWIRTLTKGWDGLTRHALQTGGRLGYVQGVEQQPARARWRHVELRRRGVPARHVGDRAPLSAKVVRQRRLPA